MQILISTTKICIIVESTSITGSANFASARLAIFGIKSSVQSFIPCFISFPRRITCAILKPLGGDSRNNTVAFHYAIYYFLRRPENFCNFCLSVVFLIKGFYSLNINNTLLMLPFAGHRAKNRTGVVRLKSFAALTAIGYSYHAIGTHSYVWC